MPNRLTPKHSSETNFKSAFEVDNPDLIAGNPEAHDAFESDTSPEMAEERNSAVAELGSESHDQWHNENFRNEDGTYRPRVKMEDEMDGGIRKWKNEADVSESDMVLSSVDIANTAYADLPKTEGATAISKVELAESGGVGDEEAVVGGFETGSGDHEFISMLEEHGLGYIKRNIDEFEGLDHQEVANKLVESGNGDSIASYLEKFKGLNRKKLAKRLTKMGYEKSVNESLRDVEDWEEQGPWERRVAKQNKKVWRGGSNGEFGREASKAFLNSTPQTRSLGRVADFWSDVL